jgi:hypothetical protein
MEEATIRGDLVKSDEVSVESQETAEVSHINVSFIAVLMTVSV